MEQRKETVKKPKLELWQRRLADSNSAYAAEVEKMDGRERLYNGSRKLQPLVRGDTKRDGGWKETSHVRNIVFENIEAQVSSSIPQPKVTPRRRRDEHLADVIEHFLRNELDRLPFETMNDMAERTVPMQGGVGWLVEWDNRKRTHDTVGEVTVTAIHPKQFAPQPGVYTGIPDMDWFILKLPTTRDAIRRKYGVDLSLEGESEPELRSAGTEDTAEDAVTQYIGFETNERGGIDRYSWVNDMELEDLENYQARRQPVCRRCGRVRPLPGQLLRANVPDTLGAGEAGGVDLTDLLAEGMAEDIVGGGSPGASPRPTGPGGIMAGIEVTPGAAPEPEPEAMQYDDGPCPWCGGKDWTSEEQEYEQVLVPFTTRSGLEVPGLHPELDEEGRPVMRPTLIPFYKPDLYPILLQRSVSVFGKLLGSSDVDVIADQQNTINRIEQKIIDRLVKAGTRITLPAKANLRTDPEDGERWFLDNPADKSMIDVYEFSGDISSAMAYEAQVYEEARQELGITDSFQGRHDSTATSGVAKEFSAAQAAGRLESKRIMKQAAYATLFELMFKFWLAYSDEPRPVSWKNSRGETEYQEFDRYDFLERDEDGSYWWNDQFLFSCDTSAPLASNREGERRTAAPGGAAAGHRRGLDTGAGEHPARVDRVLRAGRADEHPDGEADHQPGGVPGMAHGL